MLGGAGNDIYGDDGNDVLIGGTGNDDLRGGYDDDTYVFATGFGNDVINEQGGGIDTIVFASGILAEDLIFTLKGEDDFVISIAGSTDTITIAGQRNGDYSQVETLRFFDNSTLDLNTIIAGLLVSTAGDDELYGSGDADVISGLAGNDLLVGREGDDTLIGGRAMTGLKAAGAAIPIFFAAVSGRMSSTTTALPMASIQSDFGRGSQQSDLIVERNGDRDLVIRINGTQDRVLIVDAFENRNAIENLRLDGGIEFIGSDFFALIDNSGEERTRSPNTPTLPRC